MIMQEESRRIPTQQSPIATAKKSNNPLDNFEVLVSARSMNRPVTNYSTSSAPSFSNVEFPILVKKKPQGPFPYLKRKSIRVDLLLKKSQKKAQKKSASKNSPILNQLKKEKKNLQLENVQLKSKLNELERKFKELIQSPIRNATTASKVCLKKECTKCHMRMNSQYLKYHQRICGNTQLNRLLNDRDLKRLEIIRQKKSSLSIKPKNNWRSKRSDFLKKIQQAKKNSKY